MNYELKQIKKLYGEQMCHFCRDSFPIILETEGKLLEVLKSNFAESHKLYSDLVQNNMLNEFKDYIYSLVNKEEKQTINIYKTPEELMRLAGYTLYKCKTESDIQSFKKYYAKGEELCTFRGNRLNSCYVFFAVRDDVEKIKRENFKNPERQDEYGTSVISIQFSRDNSHYLSIKNRYNHTVVNPDATFSNNLDNIILGLTDSFAIYYNLGQKNKNDGFEMPGYVRAKDGKWYKYNYEIDNKYYCLDNIIIDNGEVIRYPKEKYIIMNYFILDLESKYIYLYDNWLEETFHETISEIKKITIVRQGKEKIIRIINTGEEEFIITLDNENKIIGLESNIKDIYDDFLSYDKSLKTLNLPNVNQIDNNFLYGNEVLETINLPSLQQVGNCFLLNNRALTHLSLPNLVKAGYHFLNRNENIEILKLPKLQQVEAGFLRNNMKLINLSLPNLWKVEEYFLHRNENLTHLYLPKLRFIPDAFLFHNKRLTHIYVPNVEYIVGDSASNSFLHSNQQMRLYILNQIESNQQKKWFRGRVLS